MNVQCIPTDWHNQIDIFMVIGGARPVPQVDVAPGRGQWLRDLAPRRPVERAPRRSPAGHPEHTAAGRDSADGTIRSIARTSAVRTYHRRAWDADVLFSWREKLRRVGSLKLLQIFGCDTELKL